MINTHVGEVLAGRYRLEERIATGGMGTVWRAHDDVLRRMVAVKILNESLAADEEAAARFEHEALAAASISHPNMANVYDLVYEEEHPAIVMELVEGETLGARLAREGALPIDEASRITIAILSALEAAHAAGIVHRDVKPANVLLSTTGDVKVTDLGIARTLDGPAITTTGIALGTAQYAAPEQVEGKTPTPAADQYATGVVLYEMLTGQRAFKGESPVAIAVARLSQDAPPMANFVDVPAAVEAVVTRAMERDPSARFESAASMRSALEQAVQGSLPSAPQLTTRFEALRHDDPTIALSSYASAPPEEPRRAYVVPWMRRRLVAWFAPLVIVALIVVAFSTLFGGPSTTKVPSFTGMTLQQAEAAAKRSNLKITLTKVHSLKPKDIVVSQNLTAGKVLEAGSTVALKVSDGVAPCCTVPDLGGKTLEEARAALTTAKLALGVVKTVTATSGSSGVSSQSVAAGEHLAPGSTVNITITRILAPTTKGHRRKHGD